MEDVIIVDKPIMALWERKHNVVLRCITWSFMCKKFPGNSNLICIRKPSHRIALLFEAVIKKDEDS